MKRAERLAIIKLEPRLLSRDLAAAYCGLSGPTFVAECPIRPIRLRSRVLYDRRQIDKWIDSISPDDFKRITREEWLSKLD